MKSPLVDLPRHPVLSSLVVEVVKRVRLILLEELHSSRRSGRFRIKVDGLRRRSLPEILTVPSATGNTIFSFVTGVNTSPALSLLAWISNASICSNPSISATRMSSFQNSPDCNAYPMQSRQVFSRKRVIFYHRSK